MSTRCQVIVKDEYSEVWFYRHCDGYRDGVAPTLDKFCMWINEKRIRNNAEQAAGWLVILGREEYKRWEKRDHEREASQRGPFEPGHDIGMSGWDVGAYEPCDQKLHGDIEHLWIVDVKAGTWDEAASFNSSENKYTVKL